jgi:hypothetical protein
MKVIVLFAVLLALASAGVPYLPHNYIQSNASIFLDDDVYFAWRDGIVYTIEGNTIHQNNVFGTAEVVHTCVREMTGDRRQSTYVYEHVWAPNGDLLITANFWNPTDGTGKDEDFLFVYDPAAGTCEQLFRRNYDNGYVGVAVGETHGYFFCDYEMYSFDLATYTLSDAFDATGVYDFTSTNAMTQIHVLTRDGVDHGLTVRKHETMDQAVLVTLTPNSISKTDLNVLAYADSSRADYYGYNSQLQGDLFMFKTYYYICVHSVADLADITEMAFIQGEWRSESAVHMNGGYLWALTELGAGNNFTVVDLNTWDQSIVTTQGSYYDISRPVDGDEYISGQSNTYAIFITGNSFEEVPSDPNVDNFAVASTHAPLAIYYVYNEPNSRLKGIGSISFDIYMASNVDISTGYWKSTTEYYYNIFDPVSARMIFFDYAVNLIGSQFVHEICAPGSGFFGEFCAPCDCNWGSCDDGFDNDGACTCNDNVAGVSCDDCADGFFGNAGTSSCDACTCENGECDDGISGTGMCVADSCEMGWAGDNCDSCATNFEGDACDTCVMGWAGDACDTCAANFEGDACDTCMMGWAGDACDSCAANFEGDSCDTCMMGWSGDACDTCAENFAGDACDTCVEGKTGDDCSEDEASDFSNVVLGAVMMFVVLLF